MSLAVEVRGCQLDGGWTYTSDRLDRHCEDCLGCFVKWRGVLARAIRGSLSIGIAHEVTTE